MREIKFRAWNGEQMVSPDYIDRNGMAWWKENSIPTSGERIMQFTGLKDKHGKEIYEGDLIQNVSREGIRLSVFQIIYDDGSFKKQRDDGERYDFNKASISLAEIIGNIYQNPELLKP